jgi:predicted nucleic acid-binding protein
VKAFFDTNVLIAACIEGHAHHERATPLLESVIQGKTEGVVSAHSLLEAHAVLTKLPRAPRILPQQAASLIEENIVKPFTVIALTAKEYVDLVMKLGREGVWGGQAYDALHLRCAEKAGVDRIYTFNARHFEQLAPQFSGKCVVP